MLVNINYKGKIIDGDISQLKFNSWKPRQHVCKLKDYTILIFETGNCRIMGCKRPISFINKPFKINIERLQSCTVTFNLGFTVNLYKLSLKLHCMFEPEIFPAVRWLKYNPMCVNIFSSGKVVVLGIKKINYTNEIEKIKNDLMSVI